MTKQAKDAIATDVAGLMIRYSFDLGGCAIDRWVNQWLQQYPAEWLPSAVIEALYQGRYKAFSVWQILDLWRRRGRPLRHFNREFERMISGQELQLLFSQNAPQQVLDSVPEPVLVSAQANGSLLRNGNWRQPEEVAQSKGQIIQTLSNSNPAAIQAPTSLRSSTPNRLDEVDNPAQPSAIQPFKPPEEIQLILPSSRPLAVEKPPIQQFIPEPEPSEFHDKLKAIAQALVMTNAQATTAAIANADTDPQPIDSTVDSADLERADQTPKDDPATDIESED